MIFPNKLTNGDIVATTGISFGCCDQEDILRLDNAIKNLKDMGFQYLETDNTRKLNKFESSSAKERAKEFMELIENDKVKTIIAISGGEFLMEILPYLDFEKILNSTPKWIQGYSDASLLNYVITTKLNIATINSYNFKSFGMNYFHKSVLENLKFLTQDISFEQNSFKKFEGDRGIRNNPYEGFNLTKDVEYKSLYNDKNEIKGRIIGGCVDAIRVLLGTPFDNTVRFCNQFDEGMLWYFDNYDLNLPEFYRTIWQLKQAGWFDNANGFLIGRTSIDKQMFDVSYEDILHRAFDELNVPVFYDVDIGHLPPQWTIVNGSLGCFEFENGKGKLIQKMEDK